MRNAPTPASQPEQAELPAMISTLCYYEGSLGPYHPHTLCLLILVGQEYWLAGLPEYGRPLLERAVRDAGQCLARDHELRLRAIAALRDLTEQPGGRAVLQ